jgi:hypothetical protein
LAYAVAFIYVGVIWLDHHYMFERLCSWADVGGVVAGLSAFVSPPRIDEAEFAGIFLCFTGITSYYWRRALHRGRGTGLVCSPALALAIFTLIVGYYAWTSQGIRAGR